MAVVVLISLAESGSSGCADKQLAALAARSKRIAKPACSSPRSADLIDPSPFVSHAIRTQTRPHIFSVLRTSELDLLTYLQESGCIERSDSREFPIIEIEFPFGEF
jgi:hypothetical protein